MGDEYQLRKDVDKIYDDIYDYQSLKPNVYTKNELEEKLKEEYYDQSQVDSLIIGGDLTDYVKKSDTEGLIKNDGSIDETTYQELLESGVNIKTINNLDILGSGNINIQGSGGSGLLDPYLVPKSEDNRGLLCFDEYQLYHYKITSSNYNPSIDGTVTITVTVTDEEDDPVESHSFNLNIDGTDNTKTTNSSGVATHTYTCSDWGLHTFQVRDNSIQINVTGLKQVKQNVWSSSNNLTYTLYVDEMNRHCTLTITSSNTSISAGSSNYEVSGFVPSAYRSKKNKFCRLARSNSFLAYLWDTGTIGIANLGSASTGLSFGGEMDWNY